ncbi:HEAT repeat domain-containing protein [Paracraurococcus lichenis]|uniref:HEAT repeat domain-containing protein n=1 Tax=Paracraurococcus lichenis TaxID=3064888 RepID=A0ABT9E6B5_9PROT|nr:HEAT repeat domain-containing protein [Paracraurococcus sp. LOR1-02]MDO9711693.1 HEAT repeat domain-containing protein [Paracraurococcus sp. LOR1-02]
MASRPGRARPTEAALLADLAAADPGLRRAAAQALGAHPAAVPALRAALSAETKRPVQEALLAALTDIASADAVAAMLGLLRAEDAWLRNAALTALQEIGAPAAAPVRAVLDAADPDLRMAALLALAGLRCPEAEAWTIARLEQETEVNVCATAIEVLDRIGGPASAPALDRLAGRFAAEPFLAFAARAVRDRLLGEPKA